MIVKSSDEYTATITMTREEARVLHDGLTIAKLQVGDALLIGENKSVDVEYLRGFLNGIAEG